MAPHPADAVAFGKPSYERKKLFNVASDRDLLRFFNKFLAAFCARHNIKCTVAVGQAIPRGKLLQMQAYGAQLLRVTAFDTSPDVGRSVMATLTKFAAEQKSP